MPLKEYQKKRSFDKTSEPKGGRARASQDLKFVVQKHDASHLHYDFRLENKGILLSWAVPKGPSLDPKAKRLAMQTEDHPYDYKDFEGEIPEGNYGAGQVIVWDQGNYQALEGKTKSEQEKALRRGLHQGKLSFKLDGKKLKGEFSLVKTSGTNKPDNAWLLIKKADEFSASKDITKQEKSVVSGKKVSEIGVSAGLAKAELASFVKKYKLKKASAPGEIKPMLATLVAAPFSASDWLFEIKWDGYRAIAEVNTDTSGRKVKLYSRNGQDFRQKYASVASELEQITSRAVLDGEIVVLDASGRSDFGKLQNYNSKKDDLAYCVFDLLWLDGYNMTSAPLAARKELLASILPASDVIRYSDHIEIDGEKFFALAKERKLEGIMAKQKDSSYQPGKRSKSWLKVKTSHRQEAVIGGFTEPRGSRKGLGALILGVYEGKDFVYIGHSGTGLSDKQLVDLKTELAKLERKTSPFKTEPKPNAPAHWVRPERLVEVSFAEWTSGGHMRAPRIVGLRTSDKPPEKVVRERPASTSESNTASEKETNTSQNPSKSNIEFTNQDKVFWPKQKLTKGDLIDYYQNVAERMMPFLQDRPVSLLRHPNGASGKSFFQKDVDDKLAKDFQTYCRHSESNDKDINYFVTDSEAALMYQVQLGCIEINPWNSTVHNPDKPDWLVLDLDPEAISFAKVVEVALGIKDLLDELKIKSFPKTSGKTGIHIYLPLAAKYDYEQVKQFAELLARKVNRRLPKITSVERSPSKRQGKVYIDFLQNRLGQTLAAPYSVRPIASANVSMPLAWEDINKKLAPSDFTIKNTLEILKKREDPWRDFWNTKISIEKIIKKL